TLGCLGSPASRGEGAEGTAFVRPVRVGSIVLLTVVRDGAKRQVRVQLVQVNCDATTSDTPSSRGRRWDWWWSGTRSSRRAIS
ncbi:MAG: hypothetical protein Q8P98_08025, partial [Candidatus Rokubacteria bacterium]|nr:hypothetical protein [Candidatus Rokubacteria bacterium]